MPQNYLGIHGVVGFVVAVGERGKIIHFAGDLYEARVMDSPTTAHLNAVCVVSDRCAWAVGEQGAVLRWDGTVWSTVAMGAKDDELFAVWACRETDGRDSIWIGGRDTLMVYCTATGAQGTLMRTDAILLGIWGSGPDDIWFLCKGRLVLHWNGCQHVVDELRAYEDFLTGPLRRYCKGFRGVRLSVNLDLAACPIPGSYACEWRAQVDLEGGEAKEFSLCYSKRYDAAQLAAALQPEGWELLFGVRYGEDTHPCVLQIYRRQAPAGSKRK